jgi:hypothetical protein
VGNLLSSLGHFSFSGRTLLHGVSISVSLHRCSLLVFYKRTTGAVLQLRESLSKSLFEFSGFVLVVVGVTVNLYVCVY